MTGAVHVPYPTLRHQLVQQMTHTVEWVENNRDSLTKAEILGWSAYCDLLALGHSLLAKLEELQEQKKSAP